jgi:adenine-specific DNA-methyltransferase
MGKDVHRYEPLNPSNIILFPYQITKTSSRLIEPSELRTNFPRAWDYLVLNKAKLSAREHGKYSGNYFYAFSRPQNMIEYQNPKIMTPEIALGSQMTYDENGIFYHTTKVYSFVFNNNQKEDPKYWLGLLNSSLLWYFIKSTGYTLRGGYFTFKTNYLKPFPIVTVDFNDPKQVGKHDQMVALVTSMLSLKNTNPTTPQDRNFIQQQIIATNKAIDQLVYSLYDLQSEEIITIENG